MLNFDISFWCTVHSAVTASSNSAQQMWLDTGQWKCISEKNNFQQKFHILPQEKNIEADHCWDMSRNISRWSCVIVLRHGNEIPLVTRISLTTPSSLSWSTSSTSFFVSSSSLSLCSESSEFCFLLRLLSDMLLLTRRNRRISWNFLLRAVDTPDQYQWAKLSVPSSPPLWTLSAVTNEERALAGLYNITRNTACTMRSSSDTSSVKRFIHLFGTIMLQMIFILRTNVKIPADHERLHQINN